MLYNLDFRKPNLNRDQESWDARWLTAAGRGGWKFPNIGDINSQFMIWQWKAVQSKPRSALYLDYFCHSTLSLRWRHNERDSVSNHQPHDCLLNRLFRRRSEESSKLCVTGLCVGNSPGTGEFPAQRASCAENVSIWWRHYDLAALNCSWDIWFGFNWQSISPLVPKISLPDNCVGE